WGFWTLRSTESIAFTPRSLTVFVVGACLGLASFLQPGIAVLITEGVDELSGYTPGNFWWWLFVSGFLLMTFGLGMTLRDAPAARQPNRKFDLAKTN
ncbi:MAG: hypothetical protein ACR2NP_16455, partial [Pirellulaceae bacterium]